MPAPHAADPAPSRSSKKDPARKTPANGVNKKPSPPATSPAPARARASDEAAPAKALRKSPAVKPAPVARAAAVATIEPSDEKSVAKSRAKRPRAAAPRARAGGPPIALVGLLVAMGAGGGVGGALFFASNKPSTDVAIAPVASSVPVAITPAPAAEPAVAAAQSPDATSSTAAAISAAQRLLLSGHEREALDLLSTCAPSPEVDKAREGILARCREVLAEEAARLRKLARQGKAPAPHMANLRQRLPDSLRGEVDKLALALRQELAPIPSADAEADVADVAPRPTELSEPAEDEAADEPADEPAVAARPAPRPPEQPAPRPAGPSRQPAPTADEPSGDDEPFTPPSPSPSAEEEGDAVMIAALRELLHVQPRLRAGVADINYAFDSDAERLDFEMRGFDKAEINAVHGAASGHTASGNDLELGAGSRATARLQHVLDLAGDFDIEMNVWVGHSSGRSNFIMIMGKVGVRWGEQLVKLTRSSMKPLGAEPDRMAFREERDVNIKMIRRGDELKVLLNGRQVACKTFEPEDLDGKFAIVMGDLRLVVTSLRINGKVDGSKL
jgi:hypothetical protein